MCEADIVLGGVDRELREGLSSPWLPRHWQLPLSQTLLQTCGLSSQELL